MNRTRRISCALVALSLAATLMAALPGTASARIGEKREQVDARYGKPVGEWNNTRYTGIHYCTYNHDGFSILVLYILGTSYAESYAHIPATTAITGDEMGVLLDANRCGLSWLSPADVIRMRGDYDDTAKWVEGSSNRQLFDRAKRTGPFAQAHEEDFEDAPGHAAPGHQYSIESLSLWDYMRDFDAAKAKADLKKF